MTIMDANTGTTSPSATDRELDLLVRTHLPLVGHLVRELLRRLPPHISRDDLVSAGSFGLMEAIDRYDPDREASFGTFCAKRVHGAIMDYLRTNDWSARLTRKR